MFQKSVINKHLANIDSGKIDNAFTKFKENYNPSKVQKINKLKEEEYQDGFLRDIFVDVLGYILNPDENHNLSREFKNQADSKKADGAIIKNEKAIAVIELKSTKTKDFTKVTEQAFGYKNNQPDCKYVIISNFRKLRFYVDYANEYEEFDLFNLQKDDFDLLYLLLHKDSIFADLPLKLKQETKFHEKDISDRLYKDYSSFKHKVYNNLVENNPQYDKLTLFKKSQKFLDRLLFVFFAEDTGLVPPNAISKIVEQWETLKELDEYKTLYSRFVKFFEHLDKGHKYKTYELPAYNGGLFASDEILDNIKIDDEILKDDALKLSAYDFNTDVDVNILGHIFEHSLNEIEEITAELSASRGHAPLALSKRKKDGVFYTPKYITQYIVENTIGKLCKEKREELKIEEIEFDGTYKTKEGKLSAKGRNLFKTLEDYKNWLKSLKIIDPACGSGAFLNQALNFLIEEHKTIDDIIAELTGEALRLFDTDKVILENNLYGVDINDESVEIAKLSLWLRTAQKGRKLSNLNANIKCGNSLIDDPKIAGDKAFDWNKEFPQVFQEKEKKIWHITTATHNSRYSQRMFDNHVKLGEAVWLDEEGEIIITKTIAEIVKDSKNTNNGVSPIEIIEYNICGDHMHLLLVCEAEELSAIVGKIKAVSGRKYNIEKGITIPNSATSTTRGRVPLSDTEKKGKRKYNSLWTQKFGKSEVKNEEYLNNAIEYIRNNRVKHELPENPEIEKIKKEFLSSLEHAMKTEYKGGFDVVIGNPPYVPTEYIIEKEKTFLELNYQSAFGRINLYPIFYEKGLIIANNNAILGYITPYTILKNQYYIEARKYILEHSSILKIIDFKGITVFEDAAVDSIIILLQNKTKKNNTYCQIYDINNFISNKLKKIEISQQEIFQNEDLSLFVSPNDKIIKRISKNTIQLKNIVNFNQGIITGSNKNFITDIPNKITKPVITGSDFNRYSFNKSNQYIIYDIEKLHRPRKKEIFEVNEKILLRQTSSYPICSIDTSKSYTLDTVHNGIILKKEYNSKYILTLLNSKLLKFLYENQINETGKVFAQVKIIYIDPLPIKEIPQEAQQPFIEKADKMLSLNKQLQEKKTKFLNRVKDNLGATAPDNGACPVEFKLSKKLETFYNYDFKTFVAELKKRKIQLSLIQQDEWEEYFNVYKTEINQIQNKISQTDKEIDQMVYKLYELTEEEISIIENS